jgi:hypothetical protein
VCSAYGTPGFSKCSRFKRNGPSVGDAETILVGVIVLTGLFVSPVVHGKYHTAILPADHRALSVGGTLTQDGLSARPTISRMPPICPAAALPKRAFDRAAPRGVARSDRDASNFGVVTST